MPGIRHGSRGALECSDAWPQEATKRLNEDQMSRRNRSNIISPQEARYLLPQVKLMVPDLADAGRSQDSIQYVKSCMCLKANVLIAGSRIEQEFYKMQPNTMLVKKLLNLVICRILCNKGLAWSSRLVGRWILTRSAVKRAM